MQTTQIPDSIHHRKVPSILQGIPSLLQAIILSTVVHSGRIAADSSSELVDDI